MKNNRPIFIPYETKSREFDGKLLLVTHLLHSGFENLFIGSRGATKREALKHENGIYIFKSLSVSDVKFYQQLKDRNYTIALLHVEGGIHYKENKDSIISTYPQDIFKYVDFNFVFGQKIKNDILKYVGDDIYAKTYVSGDPRFDLLKKRYRNFFKEKNEELKNTYKDFILVNTSFSISNPEIGKSKLMHFFRNEKTFSEGALRKLEVKSKFFDGVFEDYLVGLKQCAESFEDINFVIRPHPSESVQTYIDYFKDTPNVYTKKQGNVADWILSSLGVIHYDCTTGLEALIAEKPVIAYVPRINEEVVAWLPIYMSKCAYSIEELKGDIATILNANFKNDLYKDREPEFKEIVNNVGDMSSNSIINELKQKLENSDVSFKLDKKHFVLMNCKAFMKSFLIKIGLKKKDMSIYLKKFESCRKYEVREKILKIKSIENYKFDFSVKRCGSEMVYVKLK